MMIRYLITAICFLLSTPVFSDEETNEELFPSTPEQIASLRSEQSYLIGGVISPLSGQPVLRETDLVAKGAQNIVLSRTFSPLYMPCSFPQYKNQQEEWDKYHFCTHLKEHYKGWQFYPHLKLKYYPLSRRILLTDPQGMSLYFSASSHFQEQVISVVGLTNALGDTPGGKYDPRNTRFSYEDNGNKIHVYSPEGVTRFYCRRKQPGDPHYMEKIGQLYLLEKEVLSNGKVLKYHYDVGGELRRIESLDPQERFVYASVKIDGSTREGNCHFTASSGLEAHYGFYKRPISWKIKRKRKHGKGQDYIKTVCPPILGLVSSPYYRHEFLDYSDKHLLTVYSGKNEVFNVNYGCFGRHPQHFRVNQLLLPVSSNDAFVPVYELSYDPPVAEEKAGVTMLKNSDGTATHYHFSKSLLTSLIQYFGQDGNLKKEKAFSWDDKQWLQAVEIRDADQNLLYRRSFEYDKFGNPIVEIFTGDLTGNGNLESFTTKRVFSEDGRNLLLKEESEDGKVVCFSYLPNTDLITSRLIKDGDKIIQREFSVYDGCNNLIQTISDDGVNENKNDLSQVTQRRIKTYILRQSAPFLHMPEWVEESYWENGVERGLTKSHFIYDRYGNVAEEEVFDAEGQHAYTIYKTYNERGDVLTETNRMGQEAVFTYDVRGRPETATNFSQRVQKAFCYDTKGRLRELTEKGDDCVIHTVSSDYDFHDRQIRKRDPLFNSTHYTYDSLVSEVIKTDFPAISSIEGEPVLVSTSSTYDPFGRELTRTDANGNVSTYRYNAYGSPAEIRYADGGKEHFRYAKNGRLAIHTDLDGVTIHFSYDVLGRVVSKAYFSDHQLAEETFTYSSFDLLTETDKEGNLRKFTYDGAGRKIREEFCGRITDFAYDALGWLATVCKHNGSNTLLIQYKRDLEGRVIEECKTDTNGSTLYQIAYSYDKDGNRETITRYIQGKEATDTFTYDSFHRLTEYQDAKDNSSKTIYNENFINQLGQRVLQKTMIDPLRIAHIETQDTLSRMIRKEVLNPGQTVLSSEELFYDPHGNIAFQKDHIYENGHFKQTQVTKYTSTPRHHIASMTRAFGTPEERTTTYTYLPSGKIATKTLPDGVALVYDYHPLGFVSRVDSSDGKIHHAFEHDKLGYLRSALDENEGSMITRKVDAFGNVLREVFPNGSVIKKDYDCFSRIVALSMDTQGDVLYTYDPLFLREVTRVSNQGLAIYSHAYEEYDLDGNLISEKLIGNLGRVTHAIDPLGLKSQISSPYFSQECQYDSIGNLIRIVSDGVEHLYSYDQLSQLSSESCSEHIDHFAYDSLYNRTQANGKKYTTNALNELISLESVSYTYDFNGNLSYKQTPSKTSLFTFDPLNRLIEVTSSEQKVNFTYDPLGRRLSKTAYTSASDGGKETVREYYLYNGQDEIGALDTAGQPKNLRVLGFVRSQNDSQTIAVEAEGQVLAPLIDVQGNIRRLVDLEAADLAASFDFTAFGEQRNKVEEASAFIPWGFASKRLDQELGLVYFGKRYYDPGCGRWLSTDPAGFVDSFNLYQYVLNNPFRYRDPRGENLLGFLCGIGQILAGGFLIATGTAIEIATCGGYTIGFTLQAKAGAALMASGLIQATAHAKDIKIPNISWKNTDVYAPDRPLPMTENGVPIPDTDAPHTQLGTKDSKRRPGEKYPQAREYDENGEPVKTIDFTDHGEPLIHQNPHEHPYEPNSTGGTPQRGSPQPLTNWIY